MTAVNHALTGALIGFIVGEPIIALPVALLSHFICDALPHFGFQDKQALAGRRFANYLMADAFLCILLVLVLIVVQPSHWLLAAVCAFTATSPDLMWIPKFLRARRHKRQKPLRSIWLFHDGIQWFQRPIGAAVEAVWLLAAVTSLAAFLR